MKLLISSCLIGEDVRYDGNNSKLSKESFKILSTYFELFSFCPEVAGGLSTPRLPAEIQTLTPLKVLNTKKEDVTQSFVLGAEKALEMCIEHNIRYALLKSKSPSCGNTLVYDGNFLGNLISRSGICAKLLTNNNITVYNENEIDLLISSLQIQ